MSTQKKVIPVDGDLRPYFEAERGPKRRALEVERWRRTKQAAARVFVRMRANMTPLIEALRKARESIEEAFWWEFYEEELAKSHGEVEDVFV